MSYNIQVFLRPEAHEKGCTMIKSMTGFGRSERIDDNRKLVVEVKTVNHRFCEINVKSSKALSPFEIKIRGLVKQYVRRGKVDIFLNFDDTSGDASVVRYDRGLAGQYVRCIDQMCENFGLQNDLRASALARFPDILTVEDNLPDQDELWDYAQPVVEEALQNLVDARKEEGKRLYDDLIKKLHNMASYVRSIEERAPQIVEEYRENLMKKTADLIADQSLDEGRVAGEIVLYADRICVDEEIVRLKSHISGAAKILDEGMADSDDLSSVGRKLDFLAQEMNREANTILSKMVDVTVSNIGIDLKTEIERIREQIQNIE